MMKRIGTWFAVGVTLGFALSLWLGPQLVTWWFTPPGNAGPFTCETQIQNATHYLVMGQLVGAGTLGILGGIGAALRGRAKPTQKTSEPASGTPPVA